MFVPSHIDVNTQLYCDTIFTSPIVLQPETLASIYTKGGGSSGKNDSAKNRLYDTLDPVTIV